MSYSTKPTITLDQLSNVNISNPVNNNFLQYNTTNGVWDNGDLSGQDINLDEIDCRVLRVSETADIVGRLANQGVASFVNDEFIFQNGISNLGDTIYIDNNNNRVGIGISNPEEDLEVDGSIQIDSANVARLKFQQSGQNPHALGEIDGEQDGVNGGQLEFYTKVDTGSLTEKLRINNVGGIGIGGANYGTSGQVLTSGGSGGSVSWTTPSGGGGGGITSFAFMALSATQQILVIKPTFALLEFDITRTADPTGNIVLDTTTNIGRVNLTDAGTYKIDIALTGDTAGTNRVVVIGQLYVNGVADTNCICYAYCRDQNSGENTGNINAILTLPANSYLELQVSRNSSTGAFVIVGTNIAIMKIA